MSEADAKLSRGLAGRKLAMEGDAEAVRIAGRRQRAHGQKHGEWRPVGAVVGELDHTRAAGAQASRE